MLIARLKLANSTYILSYVGPRYHTHIHTTIHIHIKLHTAIHTYMHTHIYTYTHRPQKRREAIWEQESNEQQGEAG